MRIGNRKSSCPGPTNRVEIGEKFLFRLRSQRHISFLLTSTINLLYTYPNACPILTYLSVQLSHHPSHTLQKCKVIPTFFPSSPYAMQSKEVKIAIKKNENILQLKWNKRSKPIWRKKRIFRIKSNDDENLGN